jgi:hypothetical protein
MTLAEERIRRALTRDAHTTEHYARAGNCKLGAAVVVLMRLEQQGVAERGRRFMSGMTWRSSSPPEATSKQSPQVGGA